MPVHVYLSRRTFTGEDCPVSSSEVDAPSRRLPWANKGAPATQIWVGRPGSASVERGQGAPGGFARGDRGAAYFPF
jgi:hypothetical protein